ncbi:MAG: hypothetical protein WC679_04540 [Bacteroidales bacterium]|jgi:hypothetical protein
MNKVKIVLDADVIIHFSKGQMLSILPKIFPTYQYIILDKVYNEISGDIKTQLDNQMTILKNITLIKFNPSGQEMKEYACLLQNFGKGESASMIYCKWNHDVLASSNLKDIEAYCNENQIAYLTTFDFLYHAVKNNLISQSEAHNFINDVLSKGSKLPPVEKFKVFVSTAVI